MNTLSEYEIRALKEALDDEYKAWSTYDQVMADFGAVQPFGNIREAEARHIEAICALFAYYGVPVSENPWPGKVARYASLQEACEAGVVAKIANGEMYKRLLGSVLRPDILTVLRNLQEASQQRHLQAFERCAQRDKVAGHGVGRHRGGRGSV